VKTSAGRRDRVHLFIIELVYNAPLARIDANMPAHMAFLKKHYTAGRFLVSGRKVPRDGGIIVAAGNSRTEIEAIVREDPFLTLGLAECRIIEFQASQVADNVQTLIGG
jgi:uncharacterized protein YciI